MKAILAVVTLLFVAGCATSKDYAAYLAAVQAASVQQAEAFKARAEALEKIASSSTDGTSKTVAAMMLGTMQAPSVNVGMPPQSEWLEAAKIFLPPLAYLGGTWIATDASKFSAQMSRDVALSTNNAFLGMGQSIQQAGVAGYPFVQAPQPSVTLSGQGVIGSGVYNPVTNTYTNSHNRNCNTTAGNGTTTGGAGGSANC